MTQQPLSDDEKWTLPPLDEIEGTSDKALRRRIHGYIEHADSPGGADQRGGGVQLARSSLTRNWSNGTRTGRRGRSSP
jgi:hypothetical protein